MEEAGAGAPAQSPPAPCAMRSARFATAEGASLLSNAMGSAMAAASAASGLGLGLLGLLARLFGGGSGNDELENAIEGMRDTIIKGCVRYDKTQSLTNTQKERARATI